ncbi:MAG: hypothetical protein LUE64_01490 [Candidatus Gastranaerophilales bacterium]|nr:hypothetical protein [Candidatus Gastranaerophilales bacterium]
MAKYKIKNTNLMHNGKSYKIGDEIELDDTAAKKLAHVLIKVSETKAAKTETANNEKAASSKTAKTSKTAQKETSESTETVKTAKSDDKTSTEEEKTGENK